MELILIVISMFRFGAIGVADGIL
jgi:hypothetical protein